MINLSIIIVNWNTEKLVVECVRSIYKNKPNKSFEVIVVDNGSSDGSSQKLAHLGGQAGYKNYKFIQNDDNLGFAKANNVGLEKANGEYVLLLNSDTEVTPGAVDKMIDFAKNNKKVGIVGPRLLNKDGSVQASVFRLPTIWRAVKQYWLRRSGYDKYYPEREEEVEAVVAAAMLITPRALKKIGGLNERYFMYFEDLDYCRAVRKAGLKVFYYPEAEVYHYHGESGKNLADEEKQWHRLVNGSRIYHGRLRFYIIYFIQRSGDIFRRRVFKR